MPSKMKFKRISISVLCNDSDANEVVESLLDWFDNHELPLWKERLRVIDIRPTTVSKKVLDFFRITAMDEHFPY